MTSALQRSTRQTAGTIPEQLTSYVVSLSRPLLGATAGLVAYAGQRVVLEDGGAAQVGAVLVASFAAGFAERLLPVNNARRRRPLGGAGPRRRRRPPDANGSGHQPPSWSTSAGDRRRRAAERPGSRVAAGPAERDRSEQVEPVGHAEIAAERVLALEHAEEQGTQPDVLRRQQQGHHRHRRVDRPVRRRPRLDSGAEAAPCLVGLAVALDVRRRISERQQDHGRVEQTLPTEAVPSFLRQGVAPETFGIAVPQRDGMPALRLARTRRPRRQLDEVLEQRRFDGSPLE